MLDRPPASVLAAVLGLLAATGCHVLAFILLLRLAAAEARGDSTFTLPYAVLAAAFAGIGIALSIVTYQEWTEGP